jgi:hypothetical protein
MPEKFDLDLGQAIEIKMLPMEKSKKLSFSRGLLNYMGIHR